MPELPEVETVAQQLGPIVSGKAIKSISVFDHKLKPSGVEQLRGWIVEEVERWGKQVVLTLARPKQRPRYLAVHLRMSGRLLWQPAPSTPSESDRQQQSIERRPPRAVFIFNHGSLAFCDTRRFGTFIVSTDPALLKPQGVDPTGAEFSTAALASLLAGCRQDLKSFLLRQDKLTGIGNIYACEALHAAGLLPGRRCEELQRHEIEKLAKAIKSILARAIKHCGTTFSDFQATTGSIGGYQKYLRVYDRESESCKRCGETVLRVPDKGRSTYYCPGCQS